MRLRPERPNHVWSYDFVQDRTHDGRIFRTLNIIDEFTKEALVIRVKRGLNSTDVVDALTDLFILRGPPEYIRSDNGAEFIAKKVRAWIGAVGAKTAFIAPGSPWENGYCESFHARFRDEFLNGELFYSLREAQIASALQHRQAAQRLGLLAASAQKHHPDGPEANDALTFKPDHPMGADQVLPQNTANPPFRHPDVTADVVDAGATTRGAQSFPRAASVRISLSNVRSDTARRNRSFFF